ncbi:MAG: DevR family CRISPR-associated autoregulator [Aquificota bacterium]|nr:DevR family CRISPR-associated autoregulator [Aquificota bacterium]
MGGLTLTIITSRASSLNYGETMGNVSVLKKVTLGDGTQRTFVSDKALKYDIRRKGKEEKGWRLLDEKLKEYVKGNLSGSTLNVDEFGKALVKDYEEFDLFGGSSQTSGPIRR